MLTPIFQESILCKLHGTRHEFIVFHHHDVRNAAEALKTAQVKGEIFG